MKLDMTDQMSIFNFGVCQFGKNEGKIYSYSIVKCETIKQKNDGISMDLQ